MLRLCYIAAGGALGAVFRYALSGWTHRFLGADFPWGTLSVNLIGSLLMGVLWGLSDIVLIPSNVRLFLFLGFLGSFTTFSAFSIENYNLLRDGEYGYVSLNIFLSVFLGIALVYLGFSISRFYAGLFK